jgi:hypothetical protein
MAPCLFEVLLPLLLEFIVQHTGKGSFVHLDATNLGLKHLLQQFVALFDIHKTSPFLGHPPAGQRWSVRTDADFRVVPIIFLSLAKTDAIAADPCWFSSTKAGDARVKIESGINGYFCRSRSRAHIALCSAPLRCNSSMPSCLDIIAEPFERGMPQTPMGTGIWIGNFGFVSYGAVARELNRRQVPT